MAASVNTDPAPSTSLVSKPVLCFLIVDGKEMFGQVTFCALFFCCFALYNQRWWTFGQPAAAAPY